MSAVHEREVRPPAATRKQPTTAVPAEAQHPLLALQQLAGNRAVTAALQGVTPVQRFVFLGHSRYKPTGAVVTSPGCALTWSGRTVRLSGLLQTYGPLSTP